MEGPRAPAPNELPQVIHFLDHHLRPGLDWSITSEYPTTLASQNSPNMRVILEGEEVLSHAVLKPMIVKTPAGVFKVAGIGSVVTSNLHRNMGLSTKIIESCLAEAIVQDCDFAILWTDIFDFYRRLGFELAGQELALIFDKKISLAQLQSHQILETTQVSADAILKLYNQHRVCTYRTPDEVRKYLQIPNARVYTSWDAAGQLRAYAIEGKGADLSGYIHEWGGNVSELLQLVSHIQGKRNPITMIIPAHSQNLRRQAIEHGAKVKNGYLGMMKILNLNRVVEKAQRYAKNLGFPWIAFQIKADGLRVESPKSSALVPFNCVAQLLFGPSAPLELRRLDAETLETLQQILPLPMWIWGWDSV